MATEAYEKIYEMYVNSVETMKKFNRTKRSAAKNYEEYRQEHDKSRELSYLGLDLLVKATEETIQNINELSPDERAKALALGSLTNRFYDLSIEESFGDFGSEFGSKFHAGHLEKISSCKDDL